ncbi:uncharacterized protein [Maniola hyperantus]|uniref:uncharacterized protein n=1 Tax=Aphantopus hyperantus TaxID=2795564 RepID=UPI003749B0CB
MQIYDKISDCIYVFNKIYAAQILFMFNSWLISTMFEICRSLSPIFKVCTHLLTLCNIISALRGLSRYVTVESFQTDMYYYFFLNLRPFIVTKMSEYLTQEWQNTLIILNHMLMYDNLNREYYSQIETFIKLVETRKLELSAVLCPVTITVLAAFAARVISYSILLIQQFYIHH